MKLELPYQQLLCCQRRSRPIPCHHRRHDAISYEPMTTHPRILDLRQYCLSRRGVESESNSQAESGFSPRSHRLLFDGYSNSGPVYFVWTKITFLLQFISLLLYLILRIKFYFYTTVHYCAPFIKMIKIFSQVILKYILKYLLELESEFDF